MWTVFTSSKMSVAILRFGNNEEYTQLSHLKVDNKINVLYLSARISIELLRYKQKSTETGDFGCERLMCV